MGRPALGHRKYNITNIWDTHHEIMRLLVMGLKRQEIATILGVSPVTVTNVQESPVCREELARLRGERDQNAVDVSARFKELAPKAVEKLEELMDCGSPQVELSATKDVLDRAGHTAIQRIRSENINMVLTREELNRIKQTARDLGLVREEGIGVRQNTGEIPSASIPIPLPIDI